MNKLVVILTLFIVMVGCSTKVSRVETSSTMDLTGRWNDTDSRLVADELIRDCLSHTWLTKYDSILRKKPVVIVGKIENKSHEHISTETFVKDIQRALLNSGRVEFVADKNEREQIRDEKADQASNASAPTAKSSGEESGADLMMIGTINTIVDQEGKKAVVFYQTNMEMVEIESHKTVWIGENKIKKYVERTNTKF
ncbi:MAG: penicillin-binding protein activator LpoB [Fibrobacter sp.]|nr:penicillin-binding protein activator LpoB [Fibrobacter sp.]